MKVCYSDPLLEQEALSCCRKLSSSGHKGFWLFALIEAHSRCSENKQTRSPFLRPTHNSDNYLEPSQSNPVNSTVIKAAASIESPGKCPALVRPEQLSFYFLWPSNFFDFFLIHDLIHKSNPIICDNHFPNWTAEIQQPFLDILMFCLVPVSTYLLWIQSWRSLMSGEAVVRKTQPQCLWL